MLTPNPVSVTLQENAVFVDTRNAIVEFRTLDSLTRDDDNTPTTQLREGLVVGESASDAGKYVDGDDATVQASVAAYVDSDEAPDTDWVSKTFTFQIPELGISVTITSGGADDTLAEFLTLLRADKTFDANFLCADNGSGALRITSIRKGVRIVVTSSLATAFGASGKESSGTLTRYGILRNRVNSILGLDDAAMDVNAHIVTGHAIVRESLLYGLNSDARLWFAKNGIELV